MSKPFAKYNTETAKKVCEHLARGETLFSLDQMPDMPCRQTIWNWIYDHPDFAEAYEKALHSGADAIVYEMDKAFKDLAFAPPQEIPRLKLWIEHLKWKAGKYNARRFGERTVIAGDKDNPLTVNLAATLDERLALRANPRTIEHDTSDQASSLPIIDATIEES